MKSKSQMISEILELVGFGKKKSIFSDGNMNREEIFAVYKWVKEKK